MCVYISYTYLYMYVHIYMYIKNPVHSSLDSELQHVCIYYSHIYVYVYIYIHMYVCMIFVCNIYILFTHIHICMYIYTYIKRALSTRPLTVSCSTCVYILYTYIIHPYIYVHKSIHICKEPVPLVL